MIFQSVYVLVVLGTSQIFFHLSSALRQRCLLITGIVQYWHLIDFVSCLQAIVSNFNQRYLERVNVKNTIIFNHLYYTEAEVVVEIKKETTFVIINV